MKKILSLTLALIMLLSVALTFASCGEKKEQTIIMGFDATYPPFTYTDSTNGSYIGFDVEYATKVCEKLGYKLEFKAVDWDAKDAQLTSGSIDCIWSGFTYEDRENDYAWTERYLDNTIVILTKDASIKKVADLAGKTVAVQSDSSGESALKGNADLVASFKDGKYLTEASYTTAFEKLTAGSYEAIIVDIGVAKYLQRTNTAMLIVDEPISTETYGVGFRKTDAELAKKVSDAMIEVAKDTAFIKGLCEKYGVEYDAFLLK